MNNYKVIQGDSLAVLRRGRSNVIDSIVTDPPSGIGFMGKEWDKDRGGCDSWIEWLQTILEECLRVLKPGGHVLIWALPRTSHWTMTAIEKAGFDIRHVVTHHYGSGFPKNHDVGKAIDKLAGAERPVIGKASDFARDGRKRDGTSHKDAETRGVTVTGKSNRWDLDVTAPATPEAQQWDGWGTALKPSTEFWILARKPFKGSVTKNVLEHGTGAINVDGCRIDSTDNVTFDREAGDRSREQYRTGTVKGSAKPAGGRFPADLILSHSDGCDEECMPDCPVGDMDRQTADLKGRGSTLKQQQRTGQDTVDYGMSYRAVQQHENNGGGASRFFYIAKPSKKERNEGRAAMPRTRKARKRYQQDVTKSWEDRAANRHPTVKPVQLMRYLTRMITPPGGKVLDPFAGSGTTGIAALREGFEPILIEAEAEYIPIIRGRLANEVENMEGAVA